MRPNLINRLKEEWNNLDPVDPLRGLIVDAIDALVEAQPSKPWVALTNEDKAEIEKIVGVTEDDDGWMVSQMFTLTEAKLREKNA